MSEYGKYQKIVQEVKEKMRKGGPHTGDQTRFEIARRWAKEQGQTFKEDRPPGPVAAGRRAPTAPGFPEAAAPKQLPAGTMRIQIPDEEVDLKD